METSERLYFKTWNSAEKVRSVLGEKKSMHDLHSGNNYHHTNYSDQVNFPIYEICNLGMHLLPEKL